MIIPTFTSIEFCVIGFIFIYGIAFGIKNSINKLIAFLGTKNLIQSDLGKGLDASWIVALVYISFLIYKAN